MKNLGPESAKDATAVTLLTFELVEFAAPRSFIFLRFGSKGARMRAAAQVC